MKRSFAPGSKVTIPFGSHGGTQTAVVDRVNFDSGIALIRKYQRRRGKWTKPQRWTLQALEDACDEAAEILKRRTLRKHAP